MYKSPETIHLMHIWSMNGVMFLYNFPFPEGSNSQKTSFPNFNSIYKTYSKMNFYFKNNKKKHKRSPPSRFSLQKYIKSKHNHNFQSFKKFHNSKL